MKKVYVVDTNVLISDPNSLFAFEDNDIIIPMIVLEELDGHKSRPDDVGRNTRHVSRTLDEMRSTGNLGVGVALPSGGTLKIVALNSDIMGNMPNEFKATKVDNMIISFMLQLQKTLSTNDDGQIPILVRCTRHKMSRLPQDARRRNTRAVISRCDCEGSSRSDS